MPARSRLGFAFLVAAIGAAGLLPVDASAGPKEDAVAALDLTPTDMVAAFDHARLAGLGGIGIPPPITGNAALDDHIRTLGEARGYQRRAEPNGALALADGWALQPEAAAAWERLQAAAAVAGHSIDITSGYRSSAHQRVIWLDRMSSTSDAALEFLMRTVALPGYSKHHTGYAVDIRSGGARLYDFQNSAAYAWLSADGFANAMRHGWLPSYPAGVDGMGPDPEPWEFVYVGFDNMVCAVFEPTAETPFCDTTGSTFAADIAWLAETELTTGCGPIRFCPDDLVTRAQAATFLWRLFGHPLATVEIGFSDVADDAYYTEAVRWMVEHEITTGTSPGLFEPDTPLTRAQFVTFLWRAVGRPEPAATVSFEDVDVDSYAAAAIAWAAAVGVTTGTSATTFSPRQAATRGQVAAFLRRASPLPAD